MLFNVFSSFFSLIFISLIVTEMIYGLYHKILLGCFVVKGDGSSADPRIPAGYGACIYAAFFGIYCLAKPDGISFIQRAIGFIFLCTAVVIYISSSLRYYHMAWYDKMHDTYTLFVEEGIYARTRNPQALSCILFLIGAIIARPHFIVILLACLEAVILAFAVVCKEQIGREYDAYSSYANRVRPIYGKVAHRLSTAFEEALSDDAESETSDTIDTAKE